MVVKNVPLRNLYEMTLRCFFLVCFFFSWAYRERYGLSSRKRAIFSVKNGCFRFQDERIFDNTDIKNIQKQRVVTPRSYHLAYKKGRRCGVQVGATIGEQFQQGAGV